MLIFHILRSILIGVIFTFLSVSIAYFFTSSMKQVYHTIWILQNNRKYFTGNLICLISSSIWIAFAWGNRFFWIDLLLLFYMSLIANFDMATGRIPIYFLLLGIVLGSLVGCLKDQLFIHLIGGVSNLFLSIIIFFAGQIYIKHVLKQDTFIPVFGIGDIYASGTLGILLGSPYGNLGVLLAMILSVFGAGIQSILTSVEFLKRRVKLGFSFYLATVLILIIKTF